MSEIQNYERKIIPEAIMLARLAQSEQMREFFIEVWKQNPRLAKQGGARVNSLMMPLESIDSGTAFTESPTAPATSKQRGASLIELIIFIVIISSAMIGILSVMNITSAHSADPLVRKQALAIAESLLEEVELMPFTFCDPNDANASTALVDTGCIGTNQDNAGGTLGPIPAGETRGAIGVATPFDNVADYAGGSAAGYTINPAADIVGNTYAGYSANVQIVREGTTFLGGSSPAGAALRITVMVTAPDNSTVALDGYRSRFSPRI